MIMPGDEHISFAHELSLWALHTVSIASYSIDNKYVSNERQDALQKRIQGKGDVRLGPLNLRQFFNLDWEVRSVQVCAYI